MDFVLLNPKPSTPYKIRITFGFYDRQTKFFQTTIPTSFFEFVDENVASVRGVVKQAAVVRAFQGFQQFVKVTPTMWDLRIDYVSCDRQAIFVNSRTRSIEAICDPSFFEVMQTSIIEILSKVPENMGESVQVSFEIFD